MISVFLTYSNIWHSPYKLDYLKLQKYTWNKVCFSDVKLWAKVMKEITMQSLPYKWPLYGSTSTYRNLTSCFALNIWRMHILFWPQFLAKSPMLCRLKGSLMPSKHGRFLSSWKCSYSCKRVNASSNTDDMFWTDIYSGVSSSNYKYSYSVLYLNLLSPCCSLVLFYLHTFWITWCLNCNSTDNTSLGPPPCCYTWHGLRASSISEKEINFNFIKVKMKDIVVYKYLKFKFNSIKFPP